MNYNWKRSVYTILLASTLALQPACAAASSSFSDIAGHWAMQEIAAAADKGWFSGVSDDAFDPNGSLTRAMFITALGRLAGVDAASSGGAAFADVSQSAYYAPYVAWAVQNGIASGATDSTFAPEEMITREEIAVMLYRYMQYAGISSTRAEQTAFSDQDEISAWAQSAVNVCVAVGLMSGRDGNQFAPKGTATRAEAASVLVRLDRLDSAGAESSASAANTQPDSADALAAAEQALSKLKTYTDYKSGAYEVITLSAQTVSYDGDNASVNGTAITITAPGVYVLSGTLTNGQIIVDSQEQENVHLVLNGVNVTCADGPAVYVKQCGKNVYISMPEGTKNTLSDQETRSNEELDACIYSTADLFLNGSGSLEIMGNYKDGIHSKDDLRITQASLTVTAQDDGLVGKDALVLGDTSLTVKAGGDGLKSTNTDASLGYVSIGSGEFTIASENDGIQAESVLCIADGTFSLTTGGGSANGAAHSAQQFGSGMRGERRQDGRNAGAQQTGTQQQAPAAPQQTGTALSDTSAAQTESASAKGLKAGALVAVSGGAFSLNCADDAVHSDGNVSIAGGAFTIETGDDGIHAGAALTVSGGTTDIAKSYEGLEGSDIVISGGDISVTASDDGINAAGDDANEGADERTGPGMGGTHTLTISGGRTTVNADGDGIDINGSGSMSGGTLLVYGPISGGDGALDYDGAFTVTGGTLLAAGSAGMSMGVTADASQAAIAQTVDTQTANTIITITNSAGSKVFTQSVPKQYAHVVVCTDGLTEGESYTLTAGTYSGTVTASASTAQTSGMGGGRPGNGGMPPNMDGSSLPDDRTPRDGAAPPGGGFPPPSQN